MVPRYSERVERCCRLYDDQKYWIHSRSADQRLRGRRIRIPNSRDEDGERCSEDATDQGGLEIKPGDTVELKPGSLHVMFVGLKKPLAAGDHINATLVFEKAGTVNVEYEVRAMGAEPGHGMPGMKM